MMFTPEPIDKKAYTQQFDRAYGRFAGLYDFAVKWLPVWRRWIGQAVPHIAGPDVLEVSFGTGFLLTQYADRFNTYGVDYNWALACTAKRNLDSAGVHANLQQADVQNLPYKSGTFDTVVNTMAFTGYPDGALALGEIRRVLKLGGRLVMVDINYPSDGNRLGTAMTHMWAAGGDIIRDMDALLKVLGFEVQEREVGGFGSVHLYLAIRKV